MKEHISDYLDFYKDEINDDNRHSRETADLLGGSKVHRHNKYNSGTYFQLFLNKKEYEFMEIVYRNSRLHFYGGYYIYVPPNVNMCEVCKYMGWKNTNPKTKMSDEQKERYFRW